MEERVPPRERVRLTRDRVLAGAMRVADQQGLASLTILDDPRACGDMSPKIHTAPESS